ncbi:hypothetical protein RHGRI_005930 [Rhododendron griersonianum]|uniref:WRKY19-like zinc finger domain-containing protein n=1 Tax=Rhododendron griersonianum TaxID=479676 RepID=A0AAV6LF83_9ERIC|nr:hypothetical protein RHGRI_005930 [Rhododendron griersonianum]
MDARFQYLRFAPNRSSNTFYLGESIQVGGCGDNCSTDLRLDSPGSSGQRGFKRKMSSIDRSMGEEVMSPVPFLYLGHSPSSSDSKGSSSTTVSSAKENDEESAMDRVLGFSLNIGNDKISNPKKSASFHPTVPDVQPPKDDLELTLGPTESDITSIHLSYSPSESVVGRPLTPTGPFHGYEGPASVRWKTVYHFHPLHTPKEATTSIFPNQAERIQDLPSSVVPTPKCSDFCASGMTQQQQKNQHQRSTGSSSKTCQFMGCGKGARGASGLCISHGGGPRCQKPECQKGAEGGTAYCKAHGGGRRCEELGCTKSAEGRTDKCIAHGGGRRCSHVGCSRAARGKTGLCIRHGGGKRCQKENCTKSAEGLSGLCISHGGGRRCQHPECAKGAQGSTMFCKAHGGGKRCKFQGGCTKGAEGSTAFCKGHGGGKRCSFEGGGVCPKSVHGGTQFCVAHGGGKRCAIPECTKSARGRTDFCVRHGGGKRCQSEGCGKSAQGATDFCKAHGGGKRCSWGQRESEFGQGESPCNLFARGKTGLCTSHGALVQDKRIHGGATLGPMVQDPKPSKPEKMKEVVIAEEGMNVDVLRMGPSIFNGKQFRLSPDRLPVGGDGGLSSTPGVPGGRVHGGISFLAMSTGSPGLGSNGSKSFIGGPSKLGKSYVAPLNFMNIRQRGDALDPISLENIDVLGDCVREEHSLLGEEDVAWEIVEPPSLEALTLDDHEPNFNDASNNFQNETQYVWDIGGENDPYVYVE